MCVDCDSTEANVLALLSKYLLMDDSIFAIISSILSTYGDSVVVVAARLIWSVRLLLVSVWAVTVKQIAGEQWCRRCL
jgi:hypothetical protein